jgi:hypothetical protein
MGRADTRNPLVQLSFIFSCNYYYCTTISFGGAAGDRGKVVGSRRKVAGSRGKVAGSREKVAGSRGRGEVVVEGRGSRGRQR